MVKAASRPFKAQPRGARINGLDANPGASGRSEPHTIPILVKEFLFFEVSSNTLGNATDYLI
jgi:hypothetical protein